MKHLFITVLIAFITISSYSQSNNEVDLFLSAFGMQKDQLVVEFVKPSEENKEAFLKVYNEYETKRKELGKITIGILGEYEKNQETMSDEEADKMMKRIFDLHHNQANLLESYYKKIKKVTNSKVATQFFQVEMFMQTSIRYAIYQSIPFVKTKE